MEMTFVVSAAMPDDGLIMALPSAGVQYAMNIDAQFADAVPRKVPDNAPIAVDEDCGWFGRMKKRGRNPIF
jgi:hypothetical protein